MTAAFLFPGQLSEARGIGREFVESDPGAREILDRASARCGVDLGRALFDGTEAEIRANLVAQAGVFAVSMMADRALRRAGVQPAAAAGYSLGNYAALVAAGALSFDHALDILMAVLRESERLGVEGSMGAVVGLSRAGVEAECERLCAEGKPVFVANVNATMQIVVSGSREGVARLLDRAAPRVLRAIPLPMSWPIHTPLMGEVSDAVAPVVAACTSIRDPRIPVYAGHRAARLHTASDVRDLLIRQIRLPSLWKETIERMTQDGYTQYLEVGPGDALTRMLRWIAREAEGKTVRTPAEVEAARRWLEASPSV
jgi:[acyl-carrier-protein] S-malonyltransferase